MGRRSFERPGPSQWVGLKNGRANVGNDGRSSEEAVWWFVGATFAFISPTLFFRDMPGWVHIGTAVLGTALLIVGFFKYREERRHARAQRFDD